MYPTLAEAEKRLPHHLRYVLLMTKNFGTDLKRRYDVKQPIAGTAAAVAAQQAMTVAPIVTPKSAADIASERRRAKALKVSIERFLHFNP